MVYRQKFDPDEFEFEFDEDELSQHGITVDEAIEIIWNGFEVAEISTVTMSAIKLPAPLMGAVC